MIALMKRKFSIESADEDEDGVEEIKGGHPASGGSAATSHVCKLIFTAMQHKKLFLDWFACILIDKNHVAVVSAPKSNYKLTVGSYFFLLDSIQPTSFGNKLWVKNVPVLLFIRVDVKPGK